VLLSLQYWLILIGLTGFFLVLTIAGLIQGQAWVDGQTVYRVLPSLVPYMAARAALGVMILAGAFVGLYNVGMTIYRGEPREP
jgi:cytochrome c oxidase cbb3-type subunit I